MTEHNINGRNIKFKIHEFEGKKSLEYYENQIISSLNKIGILKEYITIEFANEDEQPFAQVIWIINNQEFVFYCASQKTTVANLGAIAQAIQEDIRQVTRGIKDLFTIMNQYATKKVVKKNKGLLEYATKNTNYGDNSSNNLNTIKDNKNKNNIFQNNQKNNNSQKNKPENVEKDMFSIESIKSNNDKNLVFDKKYNFIKKYDDTKLNELYEKFKSECIKTNNINHLLLQALKIERINRGMKL